MSLVLHIATSQLLISLTSSSSTTLAFSSSKSSSSRLNYGFTSSNSRLLNGVQTCTPFVIKERGSLVVKASADIDGTGSVAPETPPESKGETVPVENLPLESKLEGEAKTRMKLAKKIRLRRKRLVRKRQLRKKGRWPPSKMDKNKNV